MFSLDRSRRECRENKKASELSERKALKAQREEFETAISRHLEFIDRLLSDKETLSEKCSQLATQLKNQQSGYAKRMEDLKKQHLVCEPLQPPPPPLSLSNPASLSLSLSLSF